MEEIILKDKPVFSHFDENVLSYLFYRKVWDEGIDYRIVTSEAISYAERLKVHLIEMEKIPKPLTLKDKFSAYQKAFLRKIGLKKSSAI